MCSGRTEKQSSCISFPLFDRHKSSWQGKEARPAAGSGKAEVVSLQGVAAIASCDMDTWWGDALGYPNTEVMLLPSLWESVPASVCLHSCPMLPLKCDVSFL